MGGGGEMGEGEGTGGVLGGGGDGGGGEDGGGGGGGEDAAGGLLLGVTDRALSNWVSCGGDSSPGL